MLFFQKRNFPILLLVSCGMLITFLVLRYPLTYEGGDNYAHYKMAKYAWEYPHLFLDHWGKPLYTILSSPFAQLGYPWAKLFNVIIGLLAAWFTYKTAILLQYKHDWLSILLVVFSPVYFIMFNTTMTEPLCSFLVILACWLYLRKNLVLASVIISFLPMARPEGPLWIIIFALALLMNRKIRYIPLLFTGTFLFSIIGGLYYYHDFLWLIHQNPYSSAAAAIYGTGPLFHFILNFRFLTGYGISFLILCGSFYLLYCLFKTGNPKDMVQNPEFIFLFLPCFLFVSVHSMLWWLGTGLSVGELRVIAIIVPLLALLALKGFNFIGSVIAGKQTLKGIILIVVLALVAMDTKNAFFHGYTQSETEKVVAKAASWLRVSGLDTTKIYYFNPLFYILLNKNPYDSLLIQERVPDVHHPENNIKPGSLVIWDAHLGPNEGRLPLKNLLENSNFKLLKLFSPEIPFTVLGGYHYEIYVFQKVADSLLKPNSNILKLFDFENPIGNQDSPYHSKDVAHSGNYSFRLDHQKLYSPSFTMSIGELRKKGIVKITASGYFYPVFDPGENETALIISFERDTSYNFNNIILKSLSYKLNIWNPVTLSCKIPENAKDNDVVKIFFYQPGNKFIYIDDFKVEALQTSVE